MKRLIILCYANEKEANVINETNSGIVVEDAEHLLEVLQNLQTQLNEKGYIECNSIGIEKYSRRLQTEKLALLIKRIV